MISQIITKAYLTFQEYNVTEPSGLFTYPAEVVPQFIPMVLFALFSITLMATFFSQKRLSGKGDFFASFAVAGYFVSIVAFFMTLVDGLINLPTLVICFSIALVGSIFLLIGKDRASP